MAIAANTLSALAGISLALVGTIVVLAGLFASVEEPVPQLLLPTSPGLLLPALGRGAAAVPLVQQGGVGAVAPPRKDRGRDTLGDMEHGAAAGGLSGLGGGQGVSSAGGRRTLGRNVNKVEGFLLLNFLAYLLEICSLAPGCFPPNDVWTFNLFTLLPAVQTELVNPSNTLRIALGDETEYQTPRSPPGTASWWCVGVASLYQVYVTLWSLLGRLPEPDCFGEG